MHQGPCTTGKKGHAPRTRGDDASEVMEGCSIEDAFVGVGPSRKDDASDAAESGGRVSNLGFWGVAPRTRGDDASESGDAAAAFGGVPDLVDLAFDAFDKEGAGALASWMILTGNEDALTPIVETIHQLVDEIAPEEAAHVPVSAAAEEPRRACSAQSSVQIPVSRTHTPRTHAATQASCAHGHVDASERQWPVAEQLREGCQ